MKDIPLAKCLLAWNPQWVGRHRTKGVVCVYHQENDAGVEDQLMTVFPAQDAEPDSTSHFHDRMQLQLLIEAWHMVCRDGIEPSAIHEAFSVIPEYRSMLAEDFPV